MNKQLSIYAIGIVLLMAVAIGLSQTQRTTAKVKEPTAPAPESSREPVLATMFFPKGFVTDGSISYQTHLQEAIDVAATSGRPLVFPPMIYQIDENGLRLCSKLTLSMYGAIFKLDDHRTKDGQVFVGQDVENLNIMGGELAGRLDKWPAGVNIRGIYITGKSRNIRIRDMHIHGVSSNGIGVFGTPEEPARDVWVTDCIIENGCNYYGDYQSEKPGPEKGSVREDQGLVAFYHVRDFVVRGCRFEKSRSDGTHFYKCKQGQFVHNKVYSAQMGGYFLETCEDVTATDNVIRDNGSRGVTIERGSRNCTLNGNVVANSGREGLWAPNCVGLVIQGNVFDRNGRKPNGKKDTHIWNANITVNASGDPSKTDTEDYVIANNIIYTTDGQIAAIRVDSSKAKGIIIKNNLLRGGNKQVLIEGDQPGNVVAKEND